MPYRMAAGALAFLAIAIGACGGPGKTNASSATSSTQPTTVTSTSSTLVGTQACVTSNLKMSSGSGTGAGGTGYTTFYFTNVGHSSCTLTGYPGVAVLDSQGHVVQKPAVRKAGPGTSTPVPVTTVDLAPGQMAMFLLASTDTVPNPDCPTLYSGTAIQVFPPNQTSAIVQQGAWSICDMTVGPVQPYSAGGAVH